MSESADSTMVAKIKNTAVTTKIVIAPPTFCGPLNKAFRATITAPEVPAIQATGRQRREGSRPVGNSSNRKGAQESASVPPSASTREIVLGATSDPGSTTSA